MDSSRRGREQWEGGSRRSSKKEGEEYRRGSPRRDVDGLRRGLSKDRGEGGLHRGSSRDLERGSKTSLRGSEEEAFSRSSARGSSRSTDDILISRGSSRGSELEGLVRKSSKGGELEGLVRKSSKGGELEGLVRRPSKGVELEGLVRRPSRHNDEGSGRSSTRGKKRSRDNSKHDIIHRKDSRESMMSGCIASTTPHPEKMPLQFDLSSVDQDNLESLVPLLNLASSKLWKWKSFPIILPQPVCGHPDSGTSTGTARRKTINIRDVFIEPDFNELDMVAIDSKGEPKKLNGLQLESMRRSGTFQVESVQFPGQQHTWRLSRLLQKGSETTKHTFRKDISKAVKLIVVTSRKYLTGESISVKNSWKGWKYGIENILDILLGIPHLQINNLDQRLTEERSKYLACELVSQLSSTLDPLADFVRRLIILNSTEKGKICEEKAPMINFIFQTPQGKEIDMRLFSSEVINQTIPELTRILEVESSSCWLPEFRDNIISNLDQNHSDKKYLEREVNRCVRQEYIRRVCTAIQNSPVLENVGKGIPRLLVEQLRASRACHEAEKTSQYNLERHLSKQEEILRKLHPIKSEIKEWMKERLEEAERDYLKDEEWEAHLLALRYCREERLDQHAYFLSRDHSFLIHQEPVLYHELVTNCRSATYTFSFHTQIWNPKHWIVKETYKGRTEIIPTIVHKHTGKSSYRTQPSPEDPVYLVERETVRVSSSGHVFWRWVNFLYRTSSWFWNFSFFFLVVIPWCSPLSFRAVFGKEPFYPDYEVSQKDGSIHKKYSSRTETVVSRTKSLWRHISMSRSDFENTPDRGLLGKAILRHFNRFVNYVLKGIFGTLLIILILPILCISTSVTSLAVGLTGPLLVPVSSLAYHVASAILIDPETVCLSLGLIPGIFWNIGVLGILQPLVCLLISVVLCPLGAVFWTIWASVRYALRIFWDTVMFKLLIQKRARIPSNNTFVARRISGPGLASEFYFQIKTEQALVALEAKMELEELFAFKKAMEKIISSPLEEYQEFLNKTLQPFGVSASTDIPGPYQELKQETTSLLENLNKKVYVRADQLGMNLPESTKSRIKLTTRELKLAISRGVAMAKEFYPEHVIQHSFSNPALFWQKYHLRTGDWVGLVSKLYTEIFSPGFLVPMSEADTSFHLKVEHWNLSRYLNMVLESDWTDDLDVTRVVQQAKHNMFIGAPDLDVTVFNPLERGMILPCVTRIWKERKHSLHRVYRNVPIPHPALISIIIYNREALDPIKLEDCRTILWELMKYPQPLSMEYLVNPQNEKDEENSTSQSQEDGRDSMYEMEPELSSLANSMDNLDDHAVTNRTVTERSYSVVDTRAHMEFNVRPEMLAKLPDDCPGYKYYQYSRSQADVYSPRSSHEVDQRKTKSKCSIARIASAEDMRIEDINLRDSVHTAV